MLVVTILLAVLGCVSTSNKGGFPLHARPSTPKAITEPAKVFLKCGDDFYCIDPLHLEQLRIYVIEMDGLVLKYENATKVLNE